MILTYFKTNRTANEPRHAIKPLDLVRLFPLWAHRQICQLRPSLRGCKWWLHWQCSCESANITRNPKNASQYLGIASTMAKARKPGASMSRNMKRWGKHGTTSWHNRVASSLLFIFSLLHLLSIAPSEFAILLEFLNFVSCYFSFCHFFLWYFFNVLLILVTFVFFCALVFLGFFFFFRRVRDSHYHIF